MIIGGLSLAISFAIVALLYASVGFGGGSTYIALLALTDMPFTSIPIIALLCNIIVVLGGTIRFAAQRLILWRSVWPIILCSVPAAWLGGLTPISRDDFLILLALVLIASAVMILIRPFIGGQADTDKYSDKQKWMISAILGAVIGYISGLVGIGGGIFLAPILLLIRWASPRHIAATASLFILLNSIAGIIGQTAKYDGMLWGDIIAPNLPLFIAVLIGGQMGSLLAVKILPENIIKLLTVILTLYVAIRILWLSS